MSQQKNLRLKKYSKIFWKQNYLIMQVVTLELDHHELCAGFLNN